MMKRAPVKRFLETMELTLVAAAFAEEREAEAARQILAEGEVLRRRADPAGR